MLSNRLELREQILCCDRCELHTTGPVPFTGPEDAAFAIVGEAPGASEAEQGKPFVGMSGKLLRESLVEAGLDPDQAFIFNTVSCYPKGPPQPPHTEACHPNFLAQLNLTTASCFLVLGSKAMEAFRPDLRISSARGHAFQQEGKVVFMAVHPAYALRRRGDVMATFKTDLSIFAQIVAEQKKNGTHSAVVKYGALRCVVCGQLEEDTESHYVEESGLFYCGRCSSSSLEARLSKRQVNAKIGVSTPVEAPAGQKPDIEPDTELSEELKKAVELVQLTFPGTEVVPA